MRATAERLLATFTPSLMTAETLQEIFVRREPLAGRLLVNIRESARSRSRRHALLVGPRGIGKTHLVSLLYHRVKGDEALRERVRIAWLREETWEVASFLDLLRSILEALANEYGDTVLAQENEALNALPDDEAESRAVIVMREFLGDRLLLVIAENLDDLFEAIGEEGERQLRAFLQNHRIAILLATTPSLFFGVSDHDAPFYGFFNVTHLDELEIEDARQLLEKVARLRQDEGLAAFLTTPTARDRLMAVQELAGGHPRIWMLFASVMTREDLDELLPLYLKMLDDLTPYYQSLMKELPPQQRKIVTFLSKQGRAVQVKQIAEACRLTQQAAAAQLHDLKEKGFVRQEATGRESWYELREPLMRLVLEVKESRGKPIRLIVEFLRCWYSRSERRAFLESTPPEARLTREYLQAALELSVPHSLEQAVGEASPELDHLRALWKSGQVAGTLDAIEEEIERLGASATKFHWGLRAMCLVMLHRDAESIECFDYALALDPNDTVLHATRGAGLANLRRYEEALDSFDQALAVDPDNAYAHRNRAISLMKLGRTAEALDSFNRAIAINPDDAASYRYRGFVLWELGHSEEALESYDCALALEPDNPSLHRIRGIHLAAVGLTPDALESFDRVIVLDPNDAADHRDRGMALIELGRHLEALESLDRAVALDPHDEISRSLRARLYVPDRWDAFLADVRTALQLAVRTSNEYRGETLAYCCGLLRALGVRDEWPRRVDQLVCLYSEFLSAVALGQGLVQSIPTLFQPQVTAEMAQDWLAAWRAAAVDHEELEIPLRLLAAAVAWKEKPDRRVLLGLAVEERRILEGLLPGVQKADDTRPRRSRKRTR